MCEAGVDLRARAHGHRRLTCERRAEMDKEGQGQVMNDHVEDP